MHTRGVEGRAIVRHLLVGVTHRPLQPLELERSQLVDRSRLDRLQTVVSGDLLGHVGPLRLS